MLDFIFSMDMLVSIVVAIATIVVVSKTAIVVPQQEAFVVETLGKFAMTMEAGFHLLIPFLQRVAYKHTLKEVAMDVRKQDCITRDNVKISVDGVLYLRVVDASRASYGIGDYRFAVEQLAQTTLRSEFGKTDLDKTFEERTKINLEVVEELDKATEPWGVKVLRYEIQNILPPKDVLTAMEKQMRAEREKRAVILTSEGQRDAQINVAEGEKKRVVLESEATQLQQVNEANGEAAAILAIAEATAKGLSMVAKALSEDGGDKAMSLRVAEDYLDQFGKLAKAGNTLIVPANLTDVSSMIASATTVLEKTRNGGAAKAAA